MKQLEITCQTYGHPEEIRGNIRSALARNLPELPPALCSHDGTFVIVGSGPSLPTVLDQIQSEHAMGRPICAVNGAHDFLCKNGLEPELFLSVDPRLTIIGNTQLKNQYTTYLIASRCNQGLFDHLKDCKVMLWHSWSPEKECEEFSPHMGITGGSTSGLRAINIGYVLGFRKFNIYGLDSCLAEDGITKRFSGEKAGQVIDVYVGGPQGQKFLANTAMAQQAEEAQHLYNSMPDASIDFKGTGLLPAIWAERRARGLRT